MPNIKPTKNYTSLLSAQCTGCFCHSTGVRPINKITLTTKIINGERKLDLQIQNREEEGKF